MGKIYTALGLMSGTSMDGVDASIIQTDGKSKYKVILDKYYKYPLDIYNHLTTLRDKIKSSKDLIKYKKNIKSIEKDITTFHADSVKKIFGQWKEQINDVEKGFFQNVEADQSLIYEYIVHILRESSADFGNDYKERELVIVSDLMQFSKRVNFFKHCKSAKMKLKPKSKQKSDKCQNFAKLLL